LLGVYRPPNWKGKGVEKRRERGKIGKRERRKGREENTPPN